MQRPLLVFVVCLLARATLAQPPYLVKDVEPGPASGALGRTTVLNGRYLFVHEGIWSTDGTAAGTTHVKDLGPTPPLFATRATSALGRTFFGLVEETDPAPDAPNLERLWVTDGSAEGTQSLYAAFQGKFCPPNPIPIPALGPLVEYSGRVFFFAQVPGQAGSHHDLWSTDGTAAGTALTVPISPSCQKALSLVPAAGLLFFVLDRGGGTGIFIPDLWKTDGTPAGTAAVHVRADSIGTQPAGLTPFQGRLFFSARAPTGSDFTPRLWGTDGTTTTLIAAFAGRAVGGVMATDRVFFTVGGNELWTTNGMPGAERQLGTFPGLALLSTWNGALLFGSAPGGGAVQLWRLGPDDAVEKLADYVNEFPREFKPFGGRLYYDCSTADAGRELCRTDGTTLGTVRVSNVNPGAADAAPNGLGAIAQRLLFLADDGVHGQEPWALGFERIVSVGDAWVVEPIGTTATATFTVEVAPTPTSTVTVAYATADGTARAGTNYDPVSGLLTFPPGTATRTVDVVVRGDGRDSPSKTFYLDLSAPAGAVISLGRGTATIADADPTPQLTAADVSVVEGDQGQRSPVFSLSLSAPSDFTVTVGYATMDGDARAGEDYLSASGTATFAPGVIRVDVAVPVLADVRDEPNEAFLLALVGPQNATLLKTMAQATILDDDGRSPLCRPIAYVPFTIAAQGRYCLVRNLSTAIATGAAISVESDFVVLDLRGFKIGGGSAGPGTLADGVRAIARRSVTVRRGNIRGFRRGVALLEASSATHVVEDLRLDENLEAAVVVEGTGHVVRRNVIVATGGTTSAPDVTTYGILARGPSSRVIGNEVNDTLGVGTGEGTAIAVELAGGAVIERNRVGVAASASTVGVGVDVVSGDGVLVLDNRILRTFTGVRFGPGAAGKYRDNLTSGVAVPFAGGTDAGHNQ
ncbi:MAG TPA: Calx-beta domain-containing protein [Vicinamibacteria bacterium]